MSGSTLNAQISGTSNFPGFKNDNNRKLDLTNCSAHVQSMNMCENEDAKRNSPETKSNLFLLSCTNEKFPNGRIKGTPEIRRSSNSVENGSTKETCTNGQKSVRFRRTSTEMNQEKDGDERNFLEANDTSDLRLIVEGKSLYVSRILLSVVSPILKDLLSKRSREQNTLEIQLQGKKFDEVLEFLKCIYPDMLKQITDENVDLLLGMAQEYRVSSLMSRCREFLKGKLREIPIHPLTLIKSLRMSIDFNLDDLRHLCFEVAKNIPSDVLEATRGYELLTHDVTSTLTSNRLQSFEETGRKIVKRLKEAETHCGLYHKSERWGDNLCNKCLASVGKTAGFEISRLFSN
ncbi:hypothetical protein FSP39_007730 [Pinctada imbricata]|uniref:BTB domain-containing protein n=1 Tax=Pinctada imbricata TaxID=66713 RepID=A0AA89BKP1_PINIB|nr:hypothetical protein FSP39_007730 [Pinctada imbricata]